jgi:nucleotide-binding universal stress UspA family protein
MNQNIEEKPINTIDTLKHVLVVISPDLVKPGAPKESALVRRAIALAKATGCELEFLHVSHDSSLMPGSFSDNDDDVAREFVKRVDEDATLMAELVEQLRTEGIKISHDTRWDSPRTEAILRKIDEAHPDIVMKESRAHNYVMGLIVNTDWDLIRKSPAHLWFVTEQNEDNIISLVTAIGDTTNKEILSGPDYEVFSMANLIAKSFDATNTPVHAYQAPTGLENYAISATEYGGLTYPTEIGISSTEEMRHEIARRHGRAIEAFADHFDIEASLVRVAEGTPNDVLATVAADVNANLAVVGARNLSRWERWSKSVTAEPLLADAPCDILFIKDASSAPTPKVKGPLLKGEAVYDLEKAILDPEREFGSPKSLAEANILSPTLRHRILENWRLDIQTRIAEADRESPTQSNLFKLLRSVETAQGLVSRESEDTIATSTAFEH